MKRSTPETWHDGEDGGDRPDRPTERYLRIEPIGAGGMGRVWSALDTELGRTVALKELHPEASAAMAARLEREARTTAQLDHPGIVTVHDTGRSEGRPWYTMRLVRGESLGALLAARPAERMSLVRHVLDAAQAVAWAHAKGMVHRDLKPDNIMVGEMGETQVVDWGLCVEAGSAVGLAGTPQYMSPQQATGGPPDPRDDVWSLGAILYELLTGNAPRSGTSAEAVLAQASAPVAPLRPDAPPELGAIVKKAMAPEPADRYPTAKELAGDLARWLDGRPVLAHRYSPRELLLRALKAWKAPLTVAAVALVAFVGMLSVTTLQTMRERDRATAAEAEARVSLGQALAAHARAAFRAGAWPEAEVLAGEALLAGEDPEARGVLAGVAAQRKPTLIAEAAVPSCMTLRLGPDPATVVCDGGDNVSMWAIDPLRELWRVQGAGEPMVGPDVVLVEKKDGDYLLLDPASGAERATVRRMGDAWVVGEDHVLGASRIGPVFRVPFAGEPRPVATCEGSLVDVSRSGDRVVSACVGGEVLAGELRFHVDPPVSSTTTWVPRLGRLLAVNAREELILAGPEGVELLGRVDLGTVTWTAVDPAQRYAALAGSRAGLELWDLDSRARVMRLPANGDRDVRILPDGGLVEVGARWRRWSLPENFAPTAVPLPEGGASVALSPDGGEMAVGLGQGGVLRWGVGTGRALGSWDEAEVAVKSVVYAPAGLEWVAGELYRWPLGQAPAEVATLGFARRMTALADGTRVAIATREAVRAITADGRAVEYDGGVGPTAELGTSPRQRFAVVVGAGGDLRLLAPGDPVALGAKIADPDAITATVSDDGAVVYAGGTTGIRAWGRDGALRWSAPHPSPYPVDMVLSGDQRWLVAAALDGAARVYRTSDGRLSAVLRGHDARLSAVAAAVERPLVATVGWDARACIWDLSALDLPPQTAADRARTWWRMTRAEALGAVR